MDGSSQNFSDLLSNRYKDLLKKREDAGAYEALPPSFSDIPDPLAGRVIPEVEKAPSKAPDAIAQFSREDKLKRFAERVTSSDRYPSNQELSAKFGFDSDDFTALIDYKYRLMLDPEAGVYEKLSLQNEGGKSLFYRKHYAASAFTQMFNTYIDQRDHFRANDFIDEMLCNLIFSETQSTFNLENEPHPKRAIESVVTKEGPLDESEQLLLNIYEAYAYIIENELSEEGLFELRKILVRGLNAKPVRRYRTEDLNIEGNFGDVAIKAVSPTNIDLFMRRLFSYIDFSMSNSNTMDAFISSLVVHYYFLYVSPYYEYNFVLARLISAWYIIRHPDIMYKPLFLSEALCKDRRSGKYIKALKDSYDSGGDLTYFINYLADIISGYSMVYIHLAKIVDATIASGLDLSKSEERAIKVILLFPPIEDRYFDWQKFKSYDQTDFSKQYYNRLLNHLEQKGILTSRSKNAKLYRLNYERFGI